MENIQFIIKDYHVDVLGIGNILKCLISSLSVNPDTVIKCESSYIYGAYDTILDDRFIYKPEKPQKKELVKVYTCRLLILRSEEALQDTLPNEEWYMNGLANHRFNSYLSMTKRIDWNYDASKIHETVKQRIFHIIDQIRFKDIVTNHVHTMTQSFKDNCLGVSVRTWKASHEKNIPRSYAFDTYKKKIMDIVAKHPEINQLVFSFDNHSVVNEYVELCAELNIGYVILDKTEDINAIQYAIIKALALSHCTYFIGNRISTFSELVFWFGKCKPVVYTVG